MRRQKSRLRTEAEALLARAPLLHTATADPELLLHEVQVQQIELQLQNEELLCAQHALKESRDRYMELYELAPVGYLTLSAEDLIAEINLTGAQLLGEERSELLQTRFAHFIVAEERRYYYQMLIQVKKRGRRHTCALTLKRGDGSLIHTQLDCIRVKHKDAPVVRLTLTDITERKRAEAEIASLAFYDPLTLLANRRLFLDRLQHALMACHRSSKHGALLSLDLDNFKLLNDTEGHDAGDLLLQQVAQRLTATVRQVDTVGRLGGDEFVVLLEDLSQDPAEAAHQAKSVGEKLLLALDKPYLFAARHYQSTASTGITLFGKTYTPADLLLKRADLALYRAKSMGGGIAQFFDPELEASLNTRAALEADLRKALQQGQLVLHYQPQVDDHGLVMGAEALVRWQHPNRGLLGPEEFIPLAEERGMIVPLGHWVLEAACAQLVAWSAVPKTAHLTLAINLSVAECYQADMVARTLEVIERLGANPKRLIFDITEGVMLRNVDEIVAKMHRLKAHGLRFSLDDFGLGLFSLASLKKLPLDQLKVDRSFVRDLLTDPSSAAIVCTIMTLGQYLGLPVTAEGVETEDQRAFLAAQGCRAYQGYLFGKPLPAAELSLHDENLYLSATA